ncbi:hypothetical protein M378DRAFT_171786 [Amanita muscaria Koide BX008]|uniref:ABC-2 type transporter transmembrane domain-containing protein n=1 Tax=Amanita muscaria (strain Koide BX008) TaxID=946122 RepID=A0A0C2WL49_AMAMK|nr:hypothetical protein M378DRAFT_171786 [Amanita muscaria Koide BX008]
MATILLLIQGRPSSSSIVYRIVYGLIGLVPTVPSFWKFMLTLVLFNLTTVSVVLWLSIAFESTSLASLVGTLFMLYNLLFTGLLINRDTVIKPLQ